MYNQYKKACTVQSKQTKQRQTVEQQISINLKTLNWKGIEEPDDNSAFFSIFLLHHHIR